MNKFYKQVIFIIIGVAIIAAGGFVIYAVSNRGAAAVGWWRFDEGVGASAYDASGNANTATITGATWKNEEECKFGKCLYFDGRGDYLTVASHATLNPTDGVTVEGWVKPNSFATSSDYASSTNSIAYKPSQYSLDINQGMPRFRAYANSTWYSVQTGEGSGGGSAAAFREPADGVLSEASASFTPAFGYRALTPTNLTAKKGVLITQSDNLQYSRGSQATPDGTNVVYENFNPNQGTLEFWVKPNDANARTIFYNDISGNGKILLYKYGSEGGQQLQLRIQSSSGAWSTAYYASAWTEGTWYHIVATWDSKNPVYNTYYAEMYLNGTAGGGYNNVSAGWTAAGANSISQFGVIRGTIAGRILNRPLSSTEVTALYNSGAGSTDSWVCDSDCVWMGNYSD